MFVQPYHIPTAIASGPPSNIASEFLWAGLAVAIIIFGVMTVILRYHWREYALDDGQVRRVEAVYLLVGFVLLATMALGAFLYGGL